MQCMRSCMLHCAAWHIFTAADLLGSAPSNFQVIMKCPVCCKKRKLKDFYKVFF